MVKGINLPMQLFSSSYLVQRPHSLLDQISCNPYLWAPKHGIQLFIVPKQSEAQSLLTEPGPEYVIYLPFRKRTPFYYKTEKEALSMLHVFCVYIHTVK